MNQGNCKKHQSNNSIKAFSLIELSIVILVIGILIAGIVAGTKLVDRISLQSARAITNSSPVNSIKDLDLWFETTSENSFNNANSIEDGTQISLWKSINPQSVQKSTTAARDGFSLPYYYEKGIKNLPVIRFKDSTNSGIAISPTMSYNYFSVFLVAFPNTTQTHYSSGNVDVTNINNILFPHICSLSGCATAGIAMGTNSIIIYERASAYLPVRNSYQGSFAKGVIVNLEYNSNTKPNLYVNGNYISNIITPSNDNFPTVRVGNTLGCQGSGCFSGDIGELIYFTRVLSSEERNSINNYLKQKWGISS